MVISVLYRNAGFGSKAARWRHEPIPLFLTIDCEPFRHLSKPLFWPCVNTLSQRRLENLPKNASASIVKNKGIGS
jgi:hypothetical protein